MRVNGKSTCYYSQYLHIHLVRFPIWYSFKASNLSRGFLALWKDGREEDYARWWLFKQLFTSWTRRHIETVTRPPPPRLSTLNFHLAFNSTHTFPTLFRRNYLQILFVCILPFWGMFTTCWFGLNDIPITITVCCLLKTYRYLIKRKTHDSAHYGLWTPHGFCLISSCKIQ